LLDERHYEHIWPERRADGQPGIKALSQKRVEFDVVEQGLL
jgi:hypothetical protein